MSNWTSSFVTRTLAAIGAATGATVLMVATVSVDNTRLQHPYGETDYAAAPQG